jgi:formylglycine-generating enzyme required for sulfatase activity
MTEPLVFPPSARASWTWLSCIAASALCGCAGAGFESGDPVAGTDANVPFETPTSDNHVTAVVDEGGAGREAGALTGCGSARLGDAPTYAREVCVAGATFTMGYNGLNLGGSFADHTPAHAVTLSAHFLDAYEVTVGRYRACVDASVCLPPQAGGGTSCAYSTQPGDQEMWPVNCVTWEQARLFCKWDGRRLPTEAEWEFGARGVSDRAYPWGIEKNCDRAVLARYAGGPCTGMLAPMPVGSFASGASPEGIFDLAGNAAEWVSDWAGSYLPATQTDPPGPSGGAVKILRGGSWDNGWSAGLAYARTGMDPGARGSWGFRCARDLK